MKTHEIKIGIKGKTSGRKAKTQKLNLSFYGRKGRKSKKTVSYGPKSGNRKGDKRQLCTVKASFRSSKELHIKNLDYIEKEGKGRDGEKPETYGSDSKEEYKKNMDEVSWRIILSPESKKVNNTLLTKEFIKKLEILTGYKFTWIAANHYDTDNYHTHILINGKDKNGKTVRFLPPDIVKTLMRDYARDICSNMIGNQTQDQISLRMNNQTNKSYYTNLDKALSHYINNNEMKDDAFENNKNAIYFQRRIQFLIDLELLEYDKKKKKYLFKKGWEEELKLIGKHSAFREGIKYLHCDPRNYKLHEIKKDGPIEGEIIKKYILQKNANEFAVVIKKEDGSGAYVPLPFYPKDCHVGDTVKIETKENKRTYIYKR